MGYLEMKRQHDGLLAEVRTKEAQLQEVEGRHRATVDRLTEEICQCQVCQPILAFTHMQLQ